MTKLIHRGNLVGKQTIENLSMGHLGNRAVLLGSDGVSLGIN